MNGTQNQISLSKAGLAQVLPACSRANRRREHLRNIGNRYCEVKIKSQSATRAAALEWGKIKEVREVIAENNTD